MNEKKNLRDSSTLPTSKGLDNEIYETTGLISSKTNQYRAIGDSLARLLRNRLEGRCSLSSIARILKECNESPNSVGYINEFLQCCGSALPSTLSMKTAKFVFYLSDEIFSIHIPLLVTIDAQSTAILKMLSKTAIKSLVIIVWVSGAFIPASYAGGLYF